MYANKRWQNPIDKISLDIEDPILITKQELDDAKSYILGSRVLSDETINSRLGKKYINFYRNLPLDYDKTLMQKIKDLTCEGHNEIVFVIGGANGLSKEVSDIANFKLSFSKMTFTQNIREEYSKYNKLAEFQLLKTDGRFSHLKLNDYQICGMSGFDYFRSYYKGGLNLYNDNYIGKILNRDGFSIDLNSSYPTVMYKEKLPTYLIALDEKKSIANPDYNNNDIMCFFTIDI
jgi:hypothetical protein